MTTYLGISLSTEKIKFARHSELARGETSTEKKRAPGSSLALIALAISSASLGRENEISEMLTLWWVQEAKALRMVFLNQQRFQ